MRRFALLVTIALTASATSASLAAQVGAPIDGERIRVFIDSPSPADDGLSPLVGTYHSFANDSLVMSVHPGASAVRIPVSTIERIDRSLGVSRLHSAWSNGWKSALLHAGVFATIHLLDPDASLHESAFDAGIEGLALGAVLGAALGAILPDERWESLGLPDS